MSTTIVKKNLSFADALTSLKNGALVSREGWNGKGMWLVLVQPMRGAITYHRGQSYRSLPWIGMKTTDDSFVPWLASQTDLLADDWCVVEVES